MYTGAYKLAINLMGGSGLPLDDHVALLRRIGWDGFFTGWKPERTAVLAEAARAHGMVYTSIHAPFTGARLLWEGGEDGLREARMLTDCVRDCAEHGIPVMVLHPFIGFEDHTPTQVGLDNLARVVEVAERMNVKLGFENVEGEEYLAAIMEAFGASPALGFCFDTGHELCYNRGKDMMALYGDKLCHTHFNDNVGVTGEDIFWTDDLHLVMGDGIADWAGIMRRIRSVDYDGILTCELTFANKPDKHTHDGYAAMGHERFYAFALARMREISNL